MFPEILSAPMADVTNPACRALFEIHGADFTFTEMINADGLLHGDTYAERHGFSISKKPYAIQISGNNAKSISCAAVILEDMFSPAQIDINMGCPSPRILKSGCGAFLMSDEKAAAQIIEDTCSVLKTPVSAKIRIFEDSKKTFSFAKSLESAGISRLTVHGRTKEMMYSGKSDKAQIKKIASELSIPVTANGDIFDGLDAFLTLKETETNSIMIGRSSIGNPFIFKKLKAFFNRLDEMDFINTDIDSVKELNFELFNKILSPFEIEQRISDFKLYCSLLEKHSLYSSVNIKSHAQWFTRGLPDSSKLRLYINDLHKNIKIPSNDVESLVEDRIILAEKIISILDDFYK